MEGPDWLVEGSDWLVERPDLVAAGSNEVSEIGAPSLCSLQPLVGADLVLTT